MGRIMRPLFIIPLVLMSLVSFPSWGLTMDDLVKREEIYYKKFTDVPFTGEVDEGVDRGSIKNGKAEGSWVIYFGDGQVRQRVNFKNGMLHGSYVSFHSNGQLFLKGDYVNGKQEGHWVWHYPSGQLSYKGVFKNGKKEGYWESFLIDGSVWKDETGIFKNGVKVSD